MISIQKFTALGLFTVLTLISSCSKDRNCRQEDSTNGIITGIVRIFCLPAPAGEFVIETDSAYRATFAAGCELPAIDFGSNTLLGVSAEGQCKISFNRSVERLENESRYHYKVIATDCGSCKSLVSSNNWVLVPKLPAGWTVSFVVIRI